MMPSRCAVLGLDGVPHEMLLDLVARGVMPACGQLLQRGFMTRMRATLPEISAVSWTSFMTASNAGRHGIFGFIDLEPGVYRLRFPSSADQKVETIFHRMGRQGKRSVVLNLPGTYPAMPFPGVLVCGFVALDLARAVYPASWLPYLQKIGYRVDVDATKSQSHRAEFFSDLCYSLELRKALFRRMWREEKWDLFMLVVTETDRLQHFFFDAWLDEGHDCHEAVLDFYRQLDDLIGEFAQAVERMPDCSLFMLSDHGFHSLKQEVYVNPLLREAGFGGAVMDGRFEKIVPSPACTAFALDPSRVFIHDQDRFANGTVPRAAVSQLREELKAYFLELKYEGASVIKDVFFSEELYDGPETVHAADLVLLSHPGFDLKGGLSRDSRFGRGHFTGMHGYDNAFFFAADNEISVPGRFTIEGAARPIMERMGVKEHG